MDSSRPSNEATAKRSRLISRIRVRSRSAIASCCFCDSTCAVVSMQTPKSPATAPPASERTGVYEKSNTAFSTVPWRSSPTWNPLSAIDSPTSTLEVWAQVCPGLSPDLARRHPQSLWVFAAGYRDERIVVDPCLFLPPGQKHGLAGTEHQLHHSNKNWRPGGIRPQRSRRPVELVDPLPHFLA